MGTQKYDHSNCISPEGKMYQVQYAQKACDNSATIVALSGKNGVVIAVDNVKRNCVESPSKRILHVNNEIGLAGAGFYPDVRALLHDSQHIADYHLGRYRDLVPIEFLVTELKYYMHHFTMGGNRPFGAELFLASWSKLKGPSLYKISPSGERVKCQSSAIGKGSQTAKSEIDKLAGKLDDMSLKELADEAKKILENPSVRGEKTSEESHVSVGGVGKSTRGQFKIFGGSG